MHYMSLNRVCLLYLSPWNRVWKSPFLSGSAGLSLRLQVSGSGVNTTSRRGIKQLGIYFGSLSIFPMKVVGGHWFIVAGGYPGPRLFDSPGSGTIFSHNPWIYLMKLRSKSQLPLSFSFLFYLSLGTGHRNRIPIFIVIIVRNRVANSAHSRLNLRKHPPGGGGGGPEYSDSDLFL